MLTLADGKLTGTATCVESNQPMTAALTGTYTAQSFDVTVTRVTGGLDRPATVAMTINGQAARPLTAGART